jgi:hypothetical protein
VVVNTSSKETTSSRKSADLLQRIKPTKENIKGAWNKYGLIVVGNVVFFILLYVFSYRPHNQESRAGELLSMAQSAETRGKFETAHEIYRKIAKDYEGVRASKMAKERMGPLKKKLSEKKPDLPPPAPCPAKCDELDLDDMLRQGPTVYISSFLAKQYGEDPTLEPKIRELISRYLGFAIMYEDATLKSLRHVGALSKPHIQKQFFDVRPKCVMTPDWIYDDFSIKNDNFYTWTNAHISLKIKQEDRELVETLRVPKLDPGQSVELGEFRVTSDGGVVSCEMTIKAEEGKNTITDEI